MEKEYKKFCQALKKVLEKKFSDASYRVEIHSVIRNNEVRYDSLIIYSTESNISPNFFIKPLYEHYKRGVPIEEIVGGIAMRYFAEQFQGKQIKVDLSYESCKNRIILRLISFEKNRKTLEICPYVTFLDMAVIFHVMVYQSENEVGSFQITSALMKKWQIDKETLLCQALENTQRLFPVKIQSMNGMLMDMLEKKEIDEDVENYFQKELIEQSVETPLILSNQSGINGAVVILYEDTLRMVSDLLEGDFYLLPSSVHEILAVPFSDSMKGTEIQEIVMEVNRECVSADEYLSDHVYYYDSEKEALEICV